VQDVIDVVRDVVGPGLGVDIGPDTPLLSTGIVDSLAVAELIERLNRVGARQLGVEDLGVDNADTPAQLLDLISP